LTQLQVLVKPISTHLPESVTGIWWLRHDDYDKR
jgi:hypothetical protein